MYYGFTKMNIKKIIIGAASALLLIGSNVATHYGTERSVVSRVVDNLAEICYNNGEGRVIETNRENVFVLCHTVVADLKKQPQKEFKQEA